jgi:hypothetical protein
MIIKENWLNEEYALWLRNKFLFDTNNDKLNNTFLKHKKTKNNISVVKDKKVLQIEDKEVKTSIKDKKEQSRKEDKKKIDKKPIPFWNFLLLLLFIGGVGYLIFIFLRKKRTDESK